MNLNLPYLKNLEQCQNILIAGIGGGFDVLCGLPLYFQLQGRGKTVHLANYSFTDFAKAKQCSKPTELIPDLLMGAMPNLTDACDYYPEGYLSLWFYESQGERVPIWMFAKTGVVPLYESYLRLIKELKIDGLLLVDGGVDSLMTGTEKDAGTLLEDSVSLAAVADLDMPKVLACVGFGTEAEDHVCHYHVLENMAQLISDGEHNFFGACALTRSQSEFTRYRQACNYVQTRRKGHISHISSRIVPAVLGQFGDYHQYPQDAPVTVCISPLMSLYWFFKADAVIHHNTLISSLKKTFTFTDVRIVYREMLYNTKTAMKERVPLPY